jgi:hypothetical protein
MYGFGKTKIVYEPKKDETLKLPENNQVLAC